MYRCVWGYNFGDAWEANKTGRMGVVDWRKVNGVGKEQKLADACSICMLFTLHGDLCTTVSVAKELPFSRELPAFPRRKQTPRGQTVVLGIVQGSFAPPQKLQAYLV